jgi:thiamine-phosphate pyrophosphorylase
LIPARPFLYPIIDTEVCRLVGFDPVALADACLAGGARVLQLRDKHGSSGDFLSLTDALVERARAVDAIVIVNDRADIARMSGASGVHVGQEDLTVAEVRSLLGAGAVVGISTHDRAQIDAATRTDATYVAVGPIFETASKNTGYGARGLDLVRYASGRGKPVVAIGGVTLATAPAVIAAGATSVAVISDLLVTGDPERRVREYILAFDSPSNGR